MLPDAAQRFRREVLDALDRFTEPGEFSYIDGDRAQASCPVCGGPLSVWFHGPAAAADLTCIDHDCPEKAIVHALAAAIGDTVA